MSNLISFSEGAGKLLREWRHRRRLSQLDLASEADISTRHLSFVETGRSAPSRAMLLRLSERLAIPLRSRNELLKAAGYAAVYPERRLDSPELTVAHRAVETILAAHAPFPALAIDRHWTLVASNTAIEPLLAGLPVALMSPPINVLRLSLHPDGLAPRIDNLGEWRSHLLSRLQQQIDQSGDARLTELHRELTDYPSRASSIPPSDHGGIAVALRLRVPGLAHPLALLSTTTVFGTPLDVTLSELALECFYPADEQTRITLQATSRNPTCDQAATRGRP